MNLPNYRVTFGGIEIDYKSNFEKCREYVPHVDQIMQILEHNDVPDACRWFFFEPYAEITWIEYNVIRAQKILDEIKEYLDEHPELTDVKFLTPDNGMFADWYFKPGNLEERQFGYSRYALCARQAELFYDFMEDVEQPRGTGLEEHYARSCHVLANQLGLSYKEEGRILFWRGVLCKLFWMFGHHKAVWIYTKIFRQKYQ